MSLLNKKVLYFLFIILSSTTIPQTIKEIKVSGNTIFSKQEIIEWSGIKTGIKTYPSVLDSVKANLSANLARQGFFNSNLDKSAIIYSADSSEVIINLQIIEGVPAYIRKVVIENSDSLDNQSVGSFAFLEGQRFNKTGIEENITLWLSELENSGYPFAKAVIRSVILSDKYTQNVFVDIYLHLDRGIKSRINKIIISGNTSTKEDVIIRELRLNKNQVYSQNQINEFPGRLNRLRFFEPVNSPEFFLNNQNEGVLSITVKEKQTNNFDGIIGYMPPAGQKKGYLTGLINVSLRNLFGTGRGAAVKWQQFERESQELELRYLEPWLFSYPFNLSGALFQRKQDTSYTQRRIEGMLEFLATEDISAGIMISSERVIPALTLTPRLIVFSSSSFTTGLNLKIDTRDDPYAPTEGYLLLNAYSFSRKKIFGPGEFINPGTKTSLYLQRLMIDFSFFYQLFSRQIIAAGVHARELRGETFEESDLFRMGGAYTLRGFRENQYLGSRVLWSNLEYRFLLTRRTYVFLFSDNGYYLRKEEPDRGVLKIESYKSGYGAGLNIETGVGVLAVSYAIAAGDPFSNGKIHFGIVNEF